ncbi:MAG: hypothetical protein EAZ09_04760 [Oscillatoriales cyanobacterium]|nr:MAG: hypothetical protein EAZ18_02915 [Oscillatoriales cyanobacterium]TAH24161.1 MAG: hypothetical protein EAZ09_04760 [Oscillatoriales cyanobacterium]
MRVVRRKKEEGRRKNTLRYFGTSTLRYFGTSTLRLRSGRRSAQCTMPNAQCPMPNAQCPYY